MSTQDDGDFRDRLRLVRHAERVLGPRGWFLLNCYGKLMAPPYSGRYVSALPTPLVRSIIARLVQGKVVPVHLMHRHVSGRYERSNLLLRGGRLYMVYENREEAA